MRQHLQNFYLQNLGGFTVVEALVAVLVFVLAITGPLTLASRVIAVGQLTKNRLTASNLAQEGFELVRNIRDGNILSGLPFDGPAGCAGENNCLRDGTYEIAPDTKGLKEADASDTFLYLRSACTGTRTCYEYQEKSVGGSTKSLFRRAVTLDRPGIEGVPIRATVVVEWLERGKPKEVRLEGLLYDWP